MPRCVALAVLALLLLQPVARAQEEPAAASQPASQPASAPATEPEPQPEPEPVTAPEPSGPLAAHEAEGAAAGAADLVEEDLDTTVEVFRRGHFRLHMGGMIQVQGAFYVGDEAARDLDDPADTEGFRVRRARFGLGGQLLRDWSFYLAADLKDTVVAAQGGDQGSEILDAKITWQRFRFVGLTAGVDKVPFSAYSLRSSSRLVIIERPLMVNHIVPARRVGLTVHGDVWRLQYAAGVYNGSDGVTSGNRMAGLAGGAQLQLHLLGKHRSFVPRKLGVSLGGGYMYDDGPAVNSHLVGANLQLEGWRTRLMGELLWMQTRPDDDPSGGSVEAGEATRWGVAGQASVFLWRELLQLAVRYEYYKDVKELPTFGEQQLISAGLNVYLYRHNLKLQVNYIYRDELEGPEVENDIGFAQLQAMF